MQLSLSSSNYIQTSLVSTGPDSEGFGKHTTFQTGRIKEQAYEDEGVWSDSWGCLNEKVGIGVEVDRDSNLDWQTVQS